MGRKNEFREQAPASWLRLEAKGEPAIFVHGLASNKLIWRRVYRT